MITYGMLVLIISGMPTEALFYRCKPEGKVVSFLSERKDGLYYGVRLHDCVDGRKVYTFSNESLKEK